MQNLVKIIFILFVFIFTVSVSYPAKADCPDAELICPSGVRVSIGTCWSSEHLQCETCRSIQSEIESKCPRPTCSGDWMGRGDGCSSPILTNALTNVFRASCNIHDLCYSTLGRSKSDCDNEFGFNMYQTCNFLGVGSLVGGALICGNTGFAVVSAVRDYGQESYDNNQKWARENCQGG